MTLANQRFVAADAIRAEVKAEVQLFAENVLAEAIGTAIRDIVEERIAALREFKFVGAWAEGEYRAGNIVSLGGAIYSCCADTKSKPGNDDKSWLLVVPRARDGRDGRDLR
jgi:hypothetical protein